MAGQKQTYLVQTLIIIGLILIINVIAQYVHGYIDLTEEKRFTLADSTEQLIEDTNDNIYIQLLLDGTFPAGFKRLQGSTIELLDQFRSINSLIDYDLEDPSEGSVEEVNAVRQQLTERGMNPVNLRVDDGDERSERLIYPYALVKNGSKQISVNLLEPQSGDIPPDVALNNSVSLLEYKFAHAIQKVTSSYKPNIVITDGHGELRDYQTAKMEEELRSTYDIGRVDITKVVDISQEAELLIVAKPTEPFSQKDLFKIDQYIMNGGKVIWLIDQFYTNLDSINQNMMYVPRPLEHGLDDMFFKYGARLAKDLVLDIECSQIPQVVGMQGGKPQQELFPWYYHPVVAPKTNHPIINNIDRVNLDFPSSIDTIKTKIPNKKTVLLSSSDYSRRQIYPMRLNFEILRMPPDVKQFNKRKIPIGIILEGRFESYFNNRVKESMEEGLKEMGKTFKKESVETKQIIIADGDIWKNKYSEEKSIISPLGYNLWEKQIYNGNRDFLLNTVEYLLDDVGLISARTKDVKLRLLNRVKTQNEKLKWQMINILLPILFIVIFGFLYNYRRKKKYGSKAT